ncbi:multiple epidermal growth factor-like domains protein 6 [Haliotis rufescens]|uniref:multiple epidermal growth factor-like domains protein 6 n=1 Tax=Haliotis rufescens TaxID=6454 RepID=UPI00201EDE04|nr:multiple epidermal growth factor-like domains protein 6 [Haliotis rufescens]
MDLHVTLSVALMFLSAQAEKCSEEQHCSNCSSTSGYCITDCFPGYFDLKCKSPCSKNCKKHECSQRGKSIPKCSDGCVPGFYGTQCNIPCPRPRGDCTRCPQGCDGTFCHLTSSCVSGCHDLYYGSNCKTCSSRCQHCNRITGTCDACHDPYHGLDCEYSCEHCSTTDCVQTCPPGMYGSKCSMRCSENCLVYPTINTVASNSSSACISECQRYSGECINGCVHGRSGTNCSSQIQCDSNCMGCNETGACVEGCFPGYYGDDCKPCSGTCFNHTCHPKNGTCDNGCIQGQYGQFCEQSCIHCQGGVCQSRTGICSEGPSAINAGTIGTSTALVAFVFGISVTVCIFYCKRVSENRDNRVDESTHTGRSRQAEPSEDYTLHRYWDIEDYDEVSQPLGQQQGASEEDNNSDPDFPMLADYLPGPLDTEDNSNDPALPVLADYFPVALDTEDNKSDPVFPVLADNFPVTLGSGDNSSDTSCSSTSGSHSYTHLVRSVFVDDPTTVVTYISPSEDNN